MVFGELKYRNKLLFHKTILFQSGLEYNLYRIRKLQTLILSNLAVPMIVANRSTWVTRLGLTAEYPATPKQFWEEWLRSYAQTKSCQKPISAIYK